MIYKAVEVIWIFLAGGTGIEGTIRGPRGPKKGDRMHLSKFNMILSKILICLTSATKDKKSGARHKGKCHATQIFHISSSSSTCRHSLSVSGIKQTL